MSITASFFTPLTPSRRNMLTAGGFSVTWLKSESGSGLIIPPACVDLRRGYWEKGNFSRNKPFDSQWIIYSRFLRSRELKVCRGWLESFYLKLFPPIHPVFMHPQPICPAYSAHAQSVCGSPGSRAHFVCSEWSRALNCLSNFYIIWNRQVGGVRRKESGGRGRFRPDSLLQSPRQSRVWLNSLD